MSKNCNLFLYSFCRPTRIRYLWNKYFAKYFVGFFDLKYSFRYKKSIRAFRDLVSHILIVDDTEKVIDPDSHDKLVLIKRWLGDSNDDELLKTAKEIKCRMDIKAEEDK